MKESKKMIDILVQIQTGAIPKTGGAHFSTAENEKGWR